MMVTNKISKHVYLFFLFCFKFSKQLLFPKLEKI